MTVAALASRASRAACGCAPVLAAAAIAVIGGCMVGPDYTAPDVSVPATFMEAGRTFDGAQRIAVDLGSWWRSFDDPTLDWLVERAVEANLDLAIARERVIEARAARVVVAAELLPQIDANGGFTRSRLSENAIDETPFAAVGPNNLFEGTFDASWELDLFGRTRRQVEAAEAEIAVAEEERRDVLVTLVSEVARNYAELRGFQRRLALANQNAAIQRDAVALTRSRFEAGLTSELDVASAEAQLAATESLAPLFRQGVTASVNRLAVLLGSPPETLHDDLAAPGAIPVGPTAIDPGDPEALVARRPDLRRSERQLAAASARIGAAEADLYPRVRLLGSIGLAAEDFSNLFEGASRIYSFGPSITWALFDGGRIRGNIRVQDSRFEQARLAYLQAIFVALEEVENALAAHRRSQERARLLAEAVRANHRRVELSTERYERGIGDFLSVLDAQRSLTLVEDDLAVTQQEVATNLVAVYKALGGS